MNDSIARTPLGPVRGTAETSDYGYNFWSFKGIPYAKPPLGDLRFQDPQPIDPWIELKDARNFGSPCHQPQMRGSEDCLYLNVYTKSLDLNAKYPVMVWIHGGAFLWDSSSDLFYGPEYMLKKDVILVTFNYRLGIFGFLNLEDEIAPGNQGLKDQVMALKWVQNNIKYFGGDPGNVTIFGESAGGASVHFLSLSSTTKGLFHKAIVQSGVALNPWAFIQNPKHCAYLMCSKLGKELRDPKSIFNFLKTVEPEKLIEVQSQLLGAEEFMKGIFMFGPGVDDKSPNPFLPIPVEQAALQAIQVPLMIGYTDREGIVFLTDLIHDRAWPKEIFDDIDSNFHKYIRPSLLDNLKSFNLTLEDIRQQYFGDEKISIDNWDKYVDLQSDIYFIEGIHRTIKIQAARGSAPTYAYQFTYDKGYSIIKAKRNISISGVAHFDELQYLFSMQYLKSVKSNQIKSVGYYKMIDRMTELWTNFAKTGRPTPNTSDLIPARWLPVDNGTVIRYFNIGEKLRMEKVLNITEQNDLKNSV